MKRQKIQNPRPVPLRIHEPDNYFLQIVSSQRFIALVALILLVLLFLPLAKSYSRRLVVEKEINEIQNQINEFERENAEMKEFLNYLSSDQSAEEQARLNLNLKKPGEAVVVIEKVEEESNSKTRSDELASSTNWQKWWKYFFN